LREALFIAYLFPPQGGGGVQRTVKFVKYLSHFGWHATVITSRKPGRVPDVSLTKDVPDTTRIMRIRGLELSPRLPWRVQNWLVSWILTVDAQVGWLPFAVQYGNALLRKNGIDLLYSTSAPYTDHLVGLRLKQQSGLPWVADFRDPWAENAFAHPPTRWHHDLIERLERKVVTTADRVLVVSEPMRQQFLRRYKNLPPEHFVVLTNGFDRDDYNDVMPKQLGNTCFHLVYTGSLYGRRRGRTILEAIRYALDRGKIDPEHFHLWMIGATGKEAARLVKDWNLTDVVKFVNYVPHAALIGYQLGADALLVIIGPGPDSEIMLPGKIFEYLATGKPILALVPPGAAADLLTESGTSRIVEPDNVSAIAKTLIQMYNQWRVGELRTNADPNVVQRYERRHLTQRLAHLFDELCETAA